MINNNLYMLKDSLLQHLKLPDIFIWFKKRINLNKTDFKICVFTVILITAAVKTLTIQSGNFFQVRQVPVSLILSISSLSSFSDVMGFIIVNLNQIFPSSSACTI